MKLPNDVVIAEEKLTGYLLVWRARNDKSGYLAHAGYESSNWESLEADLRQLARTAEAESEGYNAFGEFLSARGELHGPNGVILKVKTIWIRLAETNETRFVTLYPDKE
ncbi:MAG: hypothetical protein OES79_04225 [Planctomycetota bacterium]|nr:hypothetical protein [Planctomycetota bacterium]